MAGTLTISTLSDGTNSTSATNPIKGSAKAWVNFNGTASSGSGTIRGSYNVSSVTIPSAAKYTINFTNALTDANYVPTLAISPDQNGTIQAAYMNLGLFTTNYTSLTAPTTSGFSFALNWSSSGSPQPTYVCVSVIGN